MKQNENKATYVAPSIEIIEMENEEGVMALSGGNSVPGYGNGGNVGTQKSSRSYNASSSDLEDMINDILTVEN